MSADQKSHLGNIDPNALDALYRQFLSNPESVDESWANFFRGFSFALDNYSGAIPAMVTESGSHSKEYLVMNLIQGYRQRGHLFTQTNPVRTRRQYFPTLDLATFGLTESDLDTEFHAGTEVGLGVAKLRDIVSLLKETYCESVGVEFVSIRQPMIIDYLKKKMETCRNKSVFSARSKKAIYKQLMHAVDFEQFIHRKFIGEKRFSLEGSEALIPSLQAIGIRGLELGAKEFVIGMAHRGRLNVLANIMHKPEENIFREFEGADYEGHISLGDVKYHLGYGRDTELAPGKKIRVNLMPNPSHLETVLPILEGLSRAKIDTQHGYDASKLVPVAIHGDAAVSTQGVVYETIQMAQLDGYKTGGTIHIVINNQVGFTTHYLEGRSSTYCTDVAKVTRCPVFHVNGDDVEAIVYVSELAMEIRQRFNVDVFIDILSYRKYGHNEGDEPRFTQPLLYKVIESHPNPKEIYAARLLAEGVMSQKEIEIMGEAYNAVLEGKLALAKESKSINIRQFLPKTWSGYRYASDEDFVHASRTGVAPDKFKDVADKLVHIPENLQVYKKAVKIIEDRKKNLENGKVDWAMGELMAYGTLVSEGYCVRLSGQDAVRGTFAHRHSELTLESSEVRYDLFSELWTPEAHFEVFNSPLSEYGVLGFEYGYALGTPKTLTIWEAQFGDFHNVAQVIIDQYISSAEEKWGLMNGLVLLLPHGYEGQGPEHSSARVERFLNLAANNNMQILNCTTPANMFHALRRQMHRDFRVPLVVFTPKSLLRHPKVVSDVSELTSGHFREVIDDENTDAAKVSRVVFCTGKIYYDLSQRKEELGVRDIALVRIEQMHPFPHKQVQAIIKKYKNTKLHLWVQEEPENMGAWRYIREELNEVKLVPVARLASGSPATGLKVLHALGQKEIVDKVFRKCDCDLKNNYCALQCVEGASHKEILKQHYYFKSGSKYSI